ncbi:MAG: DUF3298 and DUF4163 domain-containing protein [Candidatus Ornithomonoglobus sp.]
MKRWLVLILTAICLLCGCSVNGGYDVTITKEEQETDYSTVYAEVIAFGGLANKEYEDELNSELEDNIFDAIGEFDQLAQESAQSMPPGVKSDLHITQNVKRNSGGIVSFITENYTYFGGAHGNTVWYPQTIDTRQEAPHNLELSELFTDDSYIERINNLIDVMVAENPDEYSELWAEPHITEDTKYEYYLTDEELVIWFPPYELSYYAKGFIEFPIRLTELSGFLKEEYRAAE